MKKTMVFLCAILLVTIYSCGNSKTSSNTSANNALTTSEIDSINTVLMSAVNSSGSTSIGASQGFMQSIAMKNITFSSTCDNSNYQFTAAVNNTQACPTAGHITYTGNLKTYCTSWTYQTIQSTNYCTCKADWDTINALTFQFGDRTNNLNDCETNGIIIDGTVYTNVTGVNSSINMTINGTLSVNRRGPSGGLVPLNSCSIFMQYRSSTGAWSGTICGRSVS